MKYPIEDQPHQIEALEAVADLFTGAVQLTPKLAMQRAPGANGHAEFTLVRETLEENLKKVTERSDGKVPVQDKLDLFEETDLLDHKRTVPSFSVEMETGTGKTFVYIDTALRLARDHGFRKFVILVHSVAIRAGVVSNFEQTSEWFKNKYVDISYRWSVLGEGSALSNFTQPSSTVQFLIASIQSIDKPKSNTLFQEAEQPQLWSEASTGVAEIAALHPVVIIDEPQNMATPKRRQAIATLNPITILRYSATHKEPYNLVHRLGPREATEKGLVKAVSVRGVTAVATGAPYIRFDKVHRKGRRLFAEATIDRKTDKGERERRSVVLQNDSDLYEASNGIDAYKGVVVESIERKPDRLVLRGGTVISLGEEIGVDRASVWKDQIRHTVRQHLKKEREVVDAGHEMKVLSLFFVERVADYEGDDAEIPAVFDQIFREEWKNSGRPQSECPDPETVRVGYFPSTKTGILKDKMTASQEEELASRVYEEIIANKHLILTRKNPRAFIFSHSALREGWDNPNVFQVCFLRHTRSELERRQQIGRGLRLPLNEDLRRVRDTRVNRLTLVVDESFDDFLAGLNKEYEAGGWGKNDQSQPDNAENEVVVRRRAEKFTSPEFDELWRRIRYKAHYRIALDGQSSLPQVVAQSPHLDAIRFIGRRANVIAVGDIAFDEADRPEAQGVHEQAGDEQSVVGQRLPNLVHLVEDHLLNAKYPLMLTRPTIITILKKIPEDKLDAALADPETWSRIVADAIRTTAIEEIVKHIHYEPSPEEDWWDADVVFLETQTLYPPPPEPGKQSISGVEDAPSDGANLFDKLVYDSGQEQEFAALLEAARDNVKLYTKLPRRFRVRTPVGDYEPDWAFVYEADGVEHLYLVRETKSTDNLDELDWEEKMKILFGARHFAAAPNGEVDFAHTTGADLKIPQSKATQSKQSAPG